MWAGEDDPQGFFLDALEKLMKYCPVGSYLVMKSTPRVLGGITLMAIEYKYNFMNVLVFIATEGSGSTEPGYTSLSCFPYMYYNISVLPIFHPHFLGSYFNACNTIDNHNIMRQSNLDIDEYWMTQSGYFILATTVILGMGITYGKLLFCHSISEGNVDNKISMKEYNNRTVYELFNNPFTYYFGRPALNIPPITIYDRPILHKRSCCTPYLTPATIYVASENSVSTLTTPSDSTKIPLLTSDYPNHYHTMNKDETYHGRIKIGYCYSK